jgi:hypothetical protein
MRPNVWAPSGGWYPDPKGWKGNLGKAYLLAGVIGAGIWYTSAQLEVRSSVRHPSPTIGCNVFNGEQWRGIHSHTDRVCPCGTWTQATRHKGHSPHGQRPLNAVPGFHPRSRGCTSARHSGSGGAPLTVRRGCSSRSGGSSAALYITTPPKPYVGLPSAVSGGLHHDACTPAVSFSPFGRRGVAQRG